MKRTNLVLDNKKLELVCRLLGERTYSGAVNKALEEIIRLSKVYKLSDAFGADLWDGDLSEMREDRASSVRKNQKR